MCVCGHGIAAHIFWNGASAACHCNCSIFEADDGTDGPKFNPNLYQHTTFKYEGRYRNASKTMSTEL